MPTGRSFGHGNLSHSPPPMGWGCSAEKTLFFVGWASAGAGTGRAKGELASAAQHVASSLHHFVFVWVLDLPLTFSELEWHKISVWSFRAGDRSRGWGLGLAAPG